MALWEVIRAGLSNQRCLAENAHIKKTHMSRENCFHCSSAIVCIRKVEDCASKCNCAPQVVRDDARGCGHPKATALQEKAHVWRESSCHCRESMLPQNKPFKSVALKWAWWTHLLRLAPAIALLHDVGPRLGRRLSTPWHVLGVHLSGHYVESIVLAKCPEHWRKRRVSCA